MRSHSLNEAELREALACVDRLMIAIPKMAKELTALKDILTEEIIHQQRERMKIKRENGD